MDTKAIILLILAAAIILAVIAVVFGFLMFTTTVETEPMIERQPVLHSVETWFGAANGQTRVNYHQFKNYAK